jgi:arylsulfatase B
MQAFLKEQGLAENTIFIFTTDNGTSSGSKVFNSQMRGAKGSEYDGGHRVPLFMHWPKGKLVGGHDVNPITAYVDVLPTLIDLCQINPPAGVKFDGTSIVPLLNAAAAGDVSPDWPDRILVTDSQRVKDPIKWRKSAVMTSKWRLVNGKELYDIKADPGQQTDVAGQHSDVVKRLTDFYEAWWTELEPSFANSTAIYLGHPADNPARLTSHDWITTKSTPWNQSHIRKAMNGDGNTGFWNVKVVEDGDYEVRLRRWPEEANLRIRAELAPGADVPGAKAFRTTPGKAITPVRARVEIGKEWAETSVGEHDKEITFQMKLKAGKTKMTAYFETDSGEKFGAYYAYVTKK